MIWFLFAFLSAFFQSTKDVFSKKGLKKFDEYLIAWSLRFFSLVFLLPVLFFVDLPQIGEKFWFALIISGSLNVFTTIFYMKAIKASDLSLTIPLLTFTPLFLLITSPLIIGEFPNLFGVIGIVLIVMGSYMLNIKKKSHGYFAPFKALLKEKGPKYMLAVAFIYSISSNFDKIGIQNSSPYFWVISVNIFISVFLFPVMYFKSNNLMTIPKNIRTLLPIGLFGSLMLIFQMTAFKLTLVAYVISIKRTSAIISVLYGHFIFKEKGIKERLLGVTIMVIGVLFITLF